MALGPFSQTARATMDDKPLFKISLAQWSLYRTLFGGKLDNLDFAATARSDCGIDAIEYVNQFFKDKAKDAAYLKDMKQRAAAAGVRSLLIMIDGEGHLGDPDEAKRKQAVENHHKWVEAAKVLGCHSIRVNAASGGSYDKQIDRAADGLRRLTEFGAAGDLNVIVENHGGLSSNGAWLAAVMRKVAHPRCGTLPDFDEQGNETHTDFKRMVKIVLDAGYHGYIGIEYEGSVLSEPEGILATKHLLERVRTELS